MPLFLNDRESESTLAGHVQMWQILRDGGRSKILEYIMFHRYFPRGGRYALRLSVIISLLAASDFSNRGWALVVASPPPNDDIKFAAESPALTANQTANATLSVFCRAANKTVPPVSPHNPLPAEPLPAEKAMNAADANSTLQVIGQLSKTQTPLCSQNGAMPSNAVRVINILAGAGPISEHRRLQSIVPHEVFILNSTRVRDVYGQVKASGTQQK